MWMSSLQIGMHSDALDLQIYAKEKKNYLGKKVHLIERFLILAEIYWHNNLQIKCLAQLDLPHTL